MERAKLEALTREFTEAFNRDDLEGVMSFMADDVVYDEFNGTRSVGKAAVRAAFAPQFRGDFGTIRFHTEDMFVDPEAGKAMISWTCHVDQGHRAGGWRGLDLLHFRDGKLVVKETYAKAKAPLYAKSA